MNSKLGWLLSGPVPSYDSQKFGTITLIDLEDTSLNYHGNRTSMKYPTTIISARQGL